MGEGRPAGSTLWVTAVVALCALVVGVGLGRFTAPDGGDDAELQAAQQRVGELEKIVEDVCDPEPPGGDASRWADGVGLVVFMAPDATDAQTAAVAEAVDGHLGVESFEFIDQEAASDEFDRLFGDREDLDPGIDLLPESFRIVPVDRGIVDALTEEFQVYDGVLRVLPRTDGDFVPFGCPDDW